jgi:hypothetical protein
MSLKTLERLAEMDVPPRPVNLRQGVHQRLNAWLLVVQLVEFVVLVLPFTFVHFLGALVGALVYSFSGRRTQR